AENRITTADTRACTVRATEGDQSSSSWLLRDGDTSAPFATAIFTGPAYGPTPGLARSGGRQESARCGPEPTTSRAECARRQRASAPPPRCRESTRTRRERPH